MDSEGRYDAARHFVPPPAERPGAQEARGDMRAGAAGAPGEGGGRGVPRAPGDPVAGAGRPWPVQGAPVDPPRPAAPPKPAVPPPPPGSPSAGAAAAVPGPRQGDGRRPDGSEPPLVRWLRAPRPAAPAGVWRHRYVPPAADDPERVSSRQLVGGALVSLLCAWLLWSLLWNGYLGQWWVLPLELLTPDSWRFSGSPTGTVVLYDAYYAVIIAVLLVVFGRIGRWAEVWRRFLRPLVRGRGPQTPGAAPAPAGEGALWPELRAHGAHAAADRLVAEAHAGAMNDVDAARLARAWRAVREGRESPAAFNDTVLRQGAAAYPHPSGRRDLAHRTAHHDLLVGQVRLGRATRDTRNPASHRGAGMALAPAELATSLLAVDPAGLSHRLTRPVTESLCLQALAGDCAVVAVGAAGAPLAPDEAFDVVVRPGAERSDCDLDLYGGTTDPDEAAAVLAEALVGDLSGQLPGGDSRRAATALAQLLGPFRGAHDRFPAVSELRDLLDGVPGRLAELRGLLEGAAAHALLRELDARQRQSERPGDVAALLADRLALLDRPAFARFFDTAGHTRQVSLRSLDHPVRIRVDLPQSGHPDASRIIARLVLAQFTACVAARPADSVFACLVMDDASHTVTPESLRALHRLRGAHAGVVLTLHGLDDVPEALRSSLLGAVGCRVAFAGVTTWDGARFAEVWGKEWVETRDVTDRQIIAEGALMKTVHVFRRLVTGKAVTAKAVTVRTVERERWSASDLANAVPPGHAVLSVRSRDGAHSPPVLVSLDG
ncbi:ATP-binding protein [Streptomyces sp. NPDC059740]|uniref:ATP-binding protein n=1 Tax=Streptomyces sp. NPDC059740 TaxID=3346926 RepID=UPI0036632A4B